jgi:ribonuclease III
MSAALRLAKTALPKLSDILGHDFRDEALLRTALTHSSGAGKRQDYQRLEFLGDRILGLVIAEELFQRFPNHREGDLARLHSGLVRGDACASVGRKIGIEDFILVGPGERRNRMHLSASLIGDVVEALVAVIYLEGGVDAARKFVLTHWRELLDDKAMNAKDPKTLVQEWALGRGLSIPAYKVVERTGPEHSPMFVIDIHVDGKDAARGSGHSKRWAEQHAAKAFLDREGIAI